MRAQGRDIVELFGYSPNDLSEEAVQDFQNHHCPFVSKPCSKTNHDQSIVYGVCSVSNGVSTGSHRDVIVCPKRLYGGDYKILEDVVHAVWGEKQNLVAGGSVKELETKAMSYDFPAIAFGQNSGKEVSVNSNGQLSMDWVIQSYENIDGKLSPMRFVGIEVQSIDITGNYRDNWSSYAVMKQSGQAHQNSLEVPNSGHGLNWANVHKRLIPQIIRKGNLYKRIDRCDGFYFLVPEIVFQKFEEVIGDIPQQSAPNRENISILTYSLDQPVAEGSIRSVRQVRSAHMKLEDVANAFINNIGENSPVRLDETIKNLI